MNAPPCPTCGTLLSEYTVTRTTNGVALVGPFTAWLCESATCDAGLVVRPVRRAAAVNCSCAGGVCQKVAGARCGVTGQVI